MLYAVALLLAAQALCCNGFLVYATKKLFHKTGAAVPTDEEPSVRTTERMKHPNFPGALPVNSTDIQTLIHQTNQANPANAILGKPATCQCIHGYPQAFSLDPIPLSGNRLNSGLLKLTCPLLVNAIDSLEDDGFIGTVNQMLQNDDTLVEFMSEAHQIHSESRKVLIESSDATSYQVIERKLGKKGAGHFMTAGVAGANPNATTPDVKCLHAWYADYIFRTATDDNSAEMHPVGNLITDELSKRGIDAYGSNDCHMICSGASSSNGQISIPKPRNKQRKRSIKGTERRRRIRHEQRQLGNDGV